MNDYVNFGATGTVIGIFNDQIEVLFDEPSIGLTSLGGRCAFFKGAVVNFFDVFNMTKWNQLI